MSAKKSDEAIPLKALEMAIVMVNAADQCDQAGQWDRDHRRACRHILDWYNSNDYKITCDKAGVKDALQKSNDEHTAAYWMQKTMDAAHEAYDRLKDTVDFKNAIKEAEAIKQRMGIGEKKKITNADRIRQMTDEELADVMQGQCACCAYQLTGCTEKECKDGAYEWLKQEVSEDARTD